MDDPIWLTTQMAIAIHKRQLAEHGGRDGTRDIGLLESAIGRARHLSVYNDATPGLPALAATYAFGIARNHPFLDGNKRTAAVVCETFLEVNGLTVTADDVAMYPVFLGLAAGDVTEAELAAWLTANTAPHAA